MAKKVFDAATLMYPLPVVLLSCRNNSGKINIITLAWAGVSASEPPMLTVGIRPSRYSYHMLYESRDFVINIPTEDQIEAVNLCGTKSGRDIDKFPACNFTPEAGRAVQSPLIKECSLNLECVLRHVVNAGSHDIFMGEVLAVHVDGSIADERGLPDPEKHRPVILHRGSYHGLGRKIRQR
ncbi:MAG: flavin reductase family protein [Bacillota bacterium]